MHQRGDSNHLRRTFLPGLCLPLDEFSFLFPHLTCPWAVADMHVHLFAKKDCSAEAWWRLPPPIKG